MQGVFSKFFPTELNSHNSFYIFDPYFKVCLHIKCLKYLKRIVYFQIQIRSVDNQKSITNWYKKSEANYQKHTCLSSIYKNFIKVFYFPFTRQTSDTFTNSSRLLLKLYIRNKILLKMFWDWHSFLIWRLSNSLLSKWNWYNLAQTFFARNVATKLQVTMADFRIFVQKGTVKLWVIMCITD